MKIYINQILFLIKKFSVYFKAFIKRSNNIGYYDSFKELWNYTNKYNSIIKVYHKLDFRTKISHIASYFSIVNLFPDKKTEIVLNTIPMSMTHVYYRKFNIDRKEFTFDKLKFYQDAIINEISIPDCYFYTDEINKINFMKEDLSNIDFIFQNYNIIAKPRFSNAGEGIFVIKNCMEIKPNYIYQELINENVEIKNLTLSNYISTIRYAVYNKKGTNIFIGSHMRLNSGKIVDHHYSGSIYIGIDNDYGTLVKYGYDKNGIKYENHPLSKIQLFGFKIPHYEKIGNEMNKISNMIINYPLLAIDVAIKDDKVSILEVNAGFHPLGLQFETPLFQHIAFKELFKY